MAPRRPARGSSSCRTRARASARCAQGVDLLARAEGAAAATLEVGILPTVAAAL